MQLFALDSSQNVVSASIALKHTDYKCMECRKEVRRRGGVHRQDHFYHLKPDPSCRQSQKSAAHLRLQQYIALQLPPGEWTLERRFPEISRIADLAWEKRQIIFEVQCSPITAAEVEQRNRDYGTLGYQVVWILHERQYNGYRASAAEIFLQNHPHYFTTMTGDGRGAIFDQLQVIHQGIRRFKKRSGAIDFSLPGENGRLYFAGDFTDRLLKGEAEAIAAQQARDQAVKALVPKRDWSLQRFYRVYLNFFHLILEKFCH